MLDENEGRLRERERRRARGSSFSQSAGDDEETEMKDSHLSIYSLRDFSSMFLALVVVKYHS
jgi:hypothetical protein